MNARAEMPDGNTAALDHYLRDLDAESAKYDRVERLCPDQDLRIEIEDSIFADRDPHDFGDFCRSHANPDLVEAAIRLAVAIVRPAIKPAKFDTDQRVRLEADVRKLIDAFVEHRFPDTREQWIEEAIRDDYGN